jgi:polypeptide N-acetylgalactosaminyltransferase
MFFSRRRSLVYKFIVLIPCCWLCFLLVTELKRPESLPVLPQKLISDNSLAIINSNSNSINGEGEHVGVGDPNPKAVSSGAERSAESNNNNYHELGVLPLPGEDRPGEMGKPFKPKNLTKDQEKLVSEGWKNNAFNQFVSDLISVRRSLPDPRDSW